MTFLQHYTIREQVLAFHLTVNVQIPQVLLCHARSRLCGLLFFLPRENFEDLFLHLYHFMLELDPFFVFKPFMLESASLSILMA